MEEEPWNNKKKKCIFVKGIRRGRCLVFCRYPSEKFEPNGILSNIEFFFIIIQILIFIGIFFFKVERKKIPINLRVGITTYLVVTSYHYLNCSFVRRSLYNFNVRFFFFFFKFVITYSYNNKQTMVIFLFFFFNEWFAGNLLPYTV